MNNRTHALSSMSRADAHIAALQLARIDYATDIAESAGTSVVVQAETMRLVLNHVERLVQFYNDNTYSAEDTTDDQ